MQNGVCWDVLWGKSRSRPVTARKCEGNVRVGGGSKMREERQSKTVNFSCYDVLTTTHFFSPFFTRLHRRQGLLCFKHVRVRALVEVFWISLRVWEGLEC